MQFCFSDGLNLVVFILTFEELTTAALPSTVKETTTVTTEGEIVSQMSDNYINKSETGLPIL